MDLEAAAGSDGCTDKAVCLPPDIRYVRKLVLRIDIAAIARAMLLAMAAQSTTTAECASIFENRHGVPERRRNDNRVEVDQVRVVRKAIAGGCLRCRYTVRIMTSIARDIGILKVP